MESKGSWRGLRDMPPGALVVSGYFLMSPLLQLFAYLAHVRFLNFGAPPWRNFVIYGLAAPVVGFLLLSRHERARFATYIYLSLEILRSVRGRHADLFFLSTGILLYLQIGEARRLYPPLKRREVLERLRRRLQIGR
ncbi:MAG: hypothetical protein HY347_00860 [candidate division NC10 bacterium]|nr:hypothetical protein [candidate division NC10 bacterium]